MQVETVERSGACDPLWSSLKNYARRSDTLLPDPEDLTAGLVQAAGVHAAMLIDFHRHDRRSVYGKRHVAISGDLDIHHMFPRALFTGRGRVPSETTKIPDRLGNLLVLPADENRSLGSKPPWQYLPDVHPDMLHDACIPSDSELWQLSRYEDFARERELLVRERLVGLDLGVS